MISYRGEYRGGGGWGQKLDRVTCLDVLLGAEIASHKNIEWKKYTWLLWTDDVLEDTKEYRRGDNTSAYTQ
jgi:hypothetical protein